MKQIKVALEAPEAEASEEEAEGACSVWDRGGGGKVCGQQGFWKHFRMRFGEGLLGDIPVHRL